MSTWFGRWIVADLWTPVWPNLAASVLWTVPALAWHHRRLRRRIDAVGRRLTDRPGAGGGG